MYGEQIKKIMKIRGLGNKELSEKSGIPLGTLNKILYGDTKNPSLESMQSIARVLGCTLDDLIFNAAADSYEPKLMAAHHDAEDWTEEELAEIAAFKEFVKSKRNK